ncbi:MAG: porin [Xanthobacteraceae bacterium]|nr:porin [Xanthobacteraceae bacterium]
MSKIKSLVLGSAAALAAISGAQAADLPVKAKAVEYVKVCSLYGAGFYYIPGTDTCIRIGGYVRAEVNINGGFTDIGYINGVGGLQNRTTNNYLSRSRILLNVDTRTATEYGVVRTFAAFGPQFSQGTDTQANGGLRVEAAFVQFAGFTFGRSASAYAFPWNGAPANINSGLFGGPNYDAGVNNIQYTWQFGNGVSASLGVDAQEQANRTQIVNYAAGITATGTNGTPPITTPGANGFYGGSNIPDIVGNLKVDQAWGLLQFSAAAHQVNAVYNGAAGSAESFGHPDDKWGFAVSGALQLKNLPTGPGDDIKITGTYTEGALRYLLGQSGATPQNIALFGATDLAVATISDASYSGVAGSSLQLTKGWGVNGGFNHNWDAHWTSSVFGSWSQVEYNGAATSLYCAAFKSGANGAALAPVTCNPNFTITQVGFNTTWKPVKNLALIGEVTWNNYDSGIKGTSTAALAPGSGKAVGAYTYKSEDVFSGVFRVQRNF